MSAHDGNIRKYLREESTVGSVGGDAGMGKSLPIGTKDKVAASDYTTKNKKTTLSKLKEKITSCQSQTH